MTRFDKFVERQALRVLPAASKVLLWLPELIVISLSWSLALVTGVTLLSLPGVLALAWAVREALKTRRANQLALGDAALGNEDQANVDQEVAA